MISLSLLVIWSPLNIIYTLKYGACPNTNADAPVIYTILVYNPFTHWILKKGMQLLMRTWNQTK